MASKSWESVVDDVLGKGRPDEIAALTDQWKLLLDKYAYGVEQVRNIRDSTEATGGASGATVAWKGPAGNAYRSYVQGIADTLHSRREQIVPVITGLQTAESALRGAMDAIPVAVVNGARLGPGSGADYRARARDAVTGHGGELALEVNGAIAKVFPLPKATVSHARAIQGAKDAAEAVIEQWYAEGSRSAQGAYDALEEAYGGAEKDVTLEKGEPIRPVGKGGDDGGDGPASTPTSTSTPTDGGGDPSAKDTGSEPPNDTKPEKDTDGDGIPDSKDPDKDGDGKPDAQEQNQDQEGTEPPGGEDGEQPPGGEEPPEDGGGVETPAPYEPEPYEPEPYEPTPYEPKPYEPSTGLAGAGGGGLGGVGGGGIGGPGVPPAGVGSGLGTAGAGGAPMGPGVMATGAAGAGSGYGRGGFMPMGGAGGHGGAGGDGGTTETWLTEDDDPWHSDDPTAPPVVGR